MTVAPWNASWTEEDAYEVRPCRWAGGKLALWSPHKPDQGRPIFAKPHMVRQRRSVAEYRCTVCGEKTTKSDRCTFWLGDTAVPGLAFVTTEAPVHKACADLAMRVCPQLRKLGVKPMRWIEPDGVIAAIIGGPAVESDFRLDLKGRTVIGHLKFAWKNPIPQVPA